MKEGWKGGEVCDVMEEQGVPCQLWWLNQGLLTSPCVSKHLNSPFALTDALLR